MAVLSVDGDTARNQLYQVSESAGTATYSYDNAGNETRLTNQNGTTVTRVFDDAGRLTSITNKTSGNTTLSSFSYEYNSCNKRTSCTEANGDVVSYGYSAAHRLTSESRTGSNAYSQSWSLDGVGNRTSQTVGGTSTTFSYSDDDELESTSGGFTNSYSYNANGEQTGRTLSGTSHTLAYDYDGQLTSITTGGNTTSFAYDALGRRFSRTAGGTTTNFIAAGNSILLEKQGTTTTATYTYGNALLRKDGEYPLFDGLGSARSETNSSQTVTATLTPDAFGQTVATTGSTASKYGYAATSGYRTDGDAGLMHVGARYYDPQVGRFASRDTVLMEHPYLYCEHDPVNAVDPTGGSRQPALGKRAWYWILVVVALVGVVVDPPMTAGKVFGVIGGGGAGVIGDPGGPWIVYVDGPNEEWPKGPPCDGLVGPDTPKTQREKTFCWLSDAAPAARPPTRAGPTAWRGHSNGRICAGHDEARAGA